MWISTFSRLAPRGPLAYLCSGWGRTARLRAVGPALQQQQGRGQQTLGSALPRGPYPSRAPLAVQKVRALEQERLLQVQWEDGGLSLYPFTWLRDNCQCPLCTLQSAQARQLSITDLDVDMGLEAVEATENNKVSIRWPDQHSSVFEAEWLKKRCFSSDARRALQEELFLNERSYWDSSLRIPSADFQQVLQDDHAALAWLLALRRTGIVYLRGAPAQRGQVVRLAERIGYLRLTFYGHTWQVQDKTMANNVAYTSGRLSLHTDYPALHFAPGVQFLHCLQQAEVGGHSEVVDGFSVAEQLRRQDPEAFRTLSSLLVDFTDTGADYTDFRLQSKKHIIDVDADGRVQRININNATRDSVLDLELEQVQPFYRALKSFMELMNRPENLVSYRMEPGDLVTFDNWRLLHGRSSYVSAVGAARRHLEGAYLDWDEVMSRLRILRAALQSTQ